MNRLFVLTLLLVLSAFAHAQAAPWNLTAAPYPSTGFVPNAATFTVNGGAPIACTLPVVTGGTQPKCSLASITAFGSYTLVMTVTFPQGCINVANQASCTNGGPVSSAPFAFTYSSGLASSPALSVTP